MGAYQARHGHREGVVVRVLRKVRLHFALHVLEKPGAPGTRAGHHQQQPRMCCGAHSGRGNTRRLHDQRIPERICSSAEPQKGSATAHRRSQDGCASGIACESCQICRVRNVEGSGQPCLWPHTRQDRSPHIHPRAQKAQERKQQCGITTRTVFEMSPTTSASHQNVRSV